MMIKHDPALVEATKHVAAEMTSIRDGEKSVTEFITRIIDTSTGDITAFAENEAVFTGKVFGG